MDITEATRELAKTNYYQTIYASGKDVGVPLFRDSSNLSDLQIRFINYLGFYSSIYTDVALGDVDEIVTTHQIYEDAWNEYKKKRNVKNAQQAKKTVDSPSESPGTSWLFKRAKKV